MKVTILGAGFSGLTLAYYLTKKGVEVEIVEMAEKAGGLISTSVTEHGFAESAASGILNSILVQQLFDEIGVKLASRLPSRKNRFIFRGRPRRWPLCFFETLSFAFKLTWSFLRRRLRPRPMESVSSWARRTGGESFERFLLAPALQGIYAGDPEQLSASLILGHFWLRKSARPRVRGTIAPERGMQELIERLIVWLRGRGVEICFSKESASPGGDSLVIATSAWDAAKILRDRAPKASSVLSHIEALPALSVTLQFSKSKRDLRGFGCLFPKEEGFHSLGVLCMTDIFANRGPHRTEMWILGGARHADQVNLADAELIERILEDRRRLTGIEAKPVSISIHRWPKALPHYSVALEEALGILELPKGIFLTGNYLGRIGLSNILDFNKELAERICG